MLAVAIEVVLLRLTRDSIYQSGGAMLLIALLISGGLWLSLGWIVFWIFRWLDSCRETWRKRPALVVEFVTCCVIGLIATIYLLSWGYYVLTGQFPTAAIFEFAWVNCTCSAFWGHLMKSSPRLVWNTGIMSIIGLTVVSWLLRRVARSRSASHAKPIRAGATRIAIVGAYAVSLIVASSLVLGDPDGGRCLARKTGMARGLNPLVTVATSLFDAMYAETVEPCLDASTLQPLAGHRPNRATSSALRPRSVVFVAIESLRHDVVNLQHQGREVMPHLNELAHHGLRFSRAYSQSTHSDYADVCVYSSLYPLRTCEHHYYSKRDPWPKTLLYDVLKSAGYATAHISSQNERWGGMDQFLDSSSIDLFYDAERNSAKSRVSPRDVGLAEAVRAGKLHGGKLEDAHTTEAAMEWITEQARQDRPFFLSINFQSSHFPYELPPDVDKPFTPSTIDFEATFLDYPREKTHVVRNAYYNALQECDRCLQRLTAGLDSLNLLDDTLFVVYGENGEAFHENGAVTHAGAPFEPQIHVACVMHAPTVWPAGTEDYPCELIDLGPTILARLGIPAHPGFQGIDVLAADRTPVEERALFLHVESGLSRSDAVILAGRWKLIHNRETDRYALFDLTVDPSESRDLLRQQPQLAGRLRDALRLWRRQQLAYYRYPFYYRQYFPPRAPRLF